MKKGFICLGISVVALACFVLLPLMVVKDASFNLINILSEAPFEFIYSNMFSLAWIPAIICGVLSLLSAIFNDRKAIMVTSLAAAALMFASFLASLDVASVAIGEAVFESNAFSYGIAFWIAFAGFAANALVAKVLEKSWNK
ncbi:MAG: hypothetical protein IJO61_05700 [Oscillospiraceae bacterium]|nr:hypothetical protein [Oscillospiraceae bacterium]MBQ6846608.1 hypothetical protein [Oscillospiraceae bacterium]MBQ7119055.1 hypothetical protein [Oscillospiraceae bacterium]